MSIAEPLIAAIGALAGAGVGGYATYRAAGPAWERAKLGAVVPLTTARLPRYQALWELTELGPEQEPRALALKDRTDLADRIHRWYYDDGSGLLLSDDARRQWVAVLAKLRDQECRENDLWRAMSCLRTRLKQDLHVHDPRIDDASCRGQPGWTRGRLDH